MLTEMQYEMVVRTKESLMTLAVDEWLLEGRDSDWFQVCADAADALECLLILDKSLRS